MLLHWSLPQASDGRAGCTAELAESISILVHRVAGKICFVLLKFREAVISLSRKGGMTSGGMAAVCGPETSALCLKGLLSPPWNR